MNFKDYIQGKRKGKEANHLEQQAQGDPFLRDAIDGFDSIDGNHLSAIESLEKELSFRLEKDARKKTLSAYRRMIAVAASLALLITTGIASLVFWVGIDNLSFQPNANTRSYVDRAPIFAQMEPDVEILIHRNPLPPPPPPLSLEILEIADFLEDPEEKDEDNSDNSSLDREREQVMDLPLPPPPLSTSPSASLPTVDEIFVVVEESPEFPGGQIALTRWLSDNIRYPIIAQENGIQGRVIVNFIIERDGSITDVQVARGVNPSLDKEAMRVVSAMPDWSPGKQRGQAVRVRFTLPVVFRLE